MSDSHPQNGRAMVLAWQRALVDHLAYEQPRNHTSVLAVGAVYVIHANADGTRAHPGQRTVAREAGMTTDTVHEAIVYLTDAGFLAFVGKRARGLHEFHLVFSQSPTESDSGAVDPASGQRPTESDAVVERPAQRPPQSPTESDKPPTSDLRSSSSEPVEGGPSFEAFHLERQRAEVRRRIKAGLPVTSPEGLARVLFKDIDLKAESRRLWKHRGCAECSGSGYLTFYPQAGGTTTARCEAEPSEAAAS